MKNKIVILAAMMLLTACSSMQGVVRDKDTGTPISSAHVKIDRASTTTGALGYYKVRGSFVPGATMMVNAPGYNIYTKTVRSTTEISDIELVKK